MHQSNKESFNMLFAFLIESQQWGMYNVQYNTQLYLW